MSEQPVEQPQTEGEEPTAAAEGGGEVQATEGAEGGAEGAGEAGNGEG